MLNKPHHPDMVERRVRIRKFERVCLAKIGFQTEAAKMGTSRLQLARLDVHTGQYDSRESHAENTQHGADTTADLKQARSRGKSRPRENQFVAPMLRLL